MLDELYRTDGYELLAIGGHPPELPRFLDFLPSDLRGRIAGTFSVDDATFTLGEIKQQASAIVDRYERSAEERMVADAVQTAAAGGLAAVGLQPCLWAGSVAAVGRLLVERAHLHRHTHGCHRRRQHLEPARRETGRRPWGRPAFWCYGREELERAGAYRVYADLPPQAEVGQLRSLSGCGTCQSPPRVRRSAVPCSISCSPRASPATPCTSPSADHPGKPRPSR